MLILILAGIAYALWAESIAAAIIVASMVLYRARRPSTFRQKFRDFQYARQASEMGAEQNDVRDS